ncbi:drug/metabolite transporter (DMT)-like permease [Pararhizobium capsulatum DSM 1112]|uniref:Drug/metabolite transporter (DMT)-like permease n=1 Tax=Pararhizobium capsulatum DSM 1112 TaxID=1121113 RepID=A0ABU0BSG4_9HYPH|nr:DMT family transporter [Pararhizobium capsulatum]MDQ0320586.1 drug/metabolite transporter (DMT)-like permease [Pararhizobium capsulatum DSM 1112]
MQSSANLRGAIFMCLAMAGFTVNDALVKSVTGVMNAGQIMLVRGAMTSVLVLLLARHFGAFRSLRLLLSPIIALRIVAEVIASITYISALGEMPLANASSILQALPLAVTLGAALFLSEPVGWRRWLAILAGFVGVLIILRPGPEGFTSAAVAVIASVVAAATRDLSTRRIAADIPSLFISATTAVIITLTGAVLVLPLGGWQPMTGTSVLHLAAASLLLLVGYQCIVLAMRHGEIAIIAPFRYTSLIWSIGIGVLFFSESPDIWTMIGVGIIIASGLYAFARENSRRLAARRLSGE